MLKMIFSVHEGQGKSIAENLMHALASVLFLDLKCSVTLRKSLLSHIRTYGGGCFTLPYKEGV